MRLDPRQVREARRARELEDLEPLVRRARSVLGIDVPADLSVRIAERWVPWADVDGSYAGVVAASRTAQVGASPDQRDPNFRNSSDEGNYGINIGGF